MKLNKLLCFVSLLPLFASCSAKDTSKTISVCASESPHAEILNNAVKPLLEKKGYTLNVTVLDWTLQNDSVYNKDYDANYFQHRPYLQQYDSGSTNYSTSYKYTKVKPVCSVHFEPLRIYEGKSKASDFDSKKKTATYEICADPSNAIRALDLLKENGVIDSYGVDSNGNPTSDTIPSNITMVAEDLLVANLSSYDYAVLPTNSALTGNIKGNDLLPTESNSVKDLRSNVLACRVKDYDSDTTYKAKIDVLVDALLDSSVSDYIIEKYNNVIIAAQTDLR